MSVKYPNYVNLTFSSEEQPNEITPSPPPRKKSLLPPQDPSKSISSKSIPYTSSSSPSESPTPTHGNSQVKDNKIDLLVQQYKQFTILKEESIDSGFARFNTIITSLKALDEGFSSKNYVRNFLKALHPKWRAKVTAIKESKDL
ncbi:hypothetical protein Tco_0633282 [Tanacetum coccineum]